VLYRLLKAFDAISGVPVLLNTSFNVKGEPIVETPQDAMACFLETGIDYLVLHDTLVSKAPLHKVLTPIVKVYGDVGSLVRTAMRA
jgi:carbamoyltransferase